MTNKPAPNLRTWHGRPTSFHAGDIITHPNNTGVVCKVTAPDRAQILGIMGWIDVQIQDDPDWRKLND